MPQGCGAEFAWTLGGCRVSRAKAPETRPSSNQGVSAPAAGAEPGGPRLRRALIAAATGADPRLSAVAVMIVLGVGLGLRLVDLARPFYGFHMWNEVYYATIARNFDHYGLLQAYNYDWRGGSELGLRLGPSPFVPWLIHFSWRLLGASEAAARAPILALGMLSLLAIYFIARELYDAATGLLAAAFAAVMPGAVFMSRQVALDSPMVAFGLTAVWTLLRARREPRGRLLMVAASSLCLGVSVFVKYTGVLFVPLLAWIWWGMLRQRRPRRWLGWLAPAAYFAAAALPALAWMARGMLHPSPVAGEGVVTQYLVRGYEWQLRYFQRAAYTTWVRTGQQVGHLLWYPLVLAAALSATPARAWAFARRHAETLLLVLPWFGPIAYPISWYHNDAYTYPALYGIAVLLAVAVQRGVQLARDGIGPVPERALLRAATVLGAVVLLACYSDYKQFYRSWYYDKDYSDNWSLQLPSNLVSQLDPYAPARRVRALNTSHAPVLADAPATLYYAQDELWRARATWYWSMLPDELDGLLKAIDSLEYAYVVFTYRPALPVQAALDRKGYEPVAPGVWQRVARPSPPGASN